MQKLRSAPLLRRAIPGRSLYVQQYTLHVPSPYCEFYVEQVRYAFRVIASGHVDDYLFDGWKQGIKKVYDID